MTDISIFLSRIPKTTCTKATQSSCKCVLVGPEDKCPAESDGCEAGETCTEVKDTICKSIPKEHCETVETTHVSTPQYIPPPYRYGK